MQELVHWGLMALSLAVALTGGVFLAFSDFIMRALRDAGGGAEAMQVINRVVLGSVFVATLKALVPLTFFAGAGGLLWAGGLPGVLMVLGALAYLGGVMAVTGLGNIPMNDRLDTMTTGGSGLRAYWPGYVAGWSRLNHLRTGAAILSAAAFATAAQLL